ncbi:hypothetical protein R1sor_008347 [Riccia sorocarpa]|uniref:Uncharacterized protein n=1 Tax=Riccia sorocarpa TaxID=122646 RepID=A0ABD3HUS8_9MARC
MILLMTDLKHIVEPDRPVSQATSSLAAGHDVPQKHISRGHGGEALYNSSLDTETGKKKLEPDTETGKKKLEPDTEAGKKKLKLDTETGKKDTNWTEEEFILSAEYFANECKLPNDGMMPNDILKSLVSDDLLEKCFGPKFGAKDVEQQRLRERKRLAQHKRRYEKTMNPERAERLKMVEEAHREAEEIKRRALEEAESIRHSARLSAEGSPGPSSLTSSVEMVPASVFVTTYKKCCGQSIRDT